MDNFESTAEDFGLESQENNIPSFENIHENIQEKIGDLSNPENEEKNSENRLKNTEQQEKVDNPNGKEKEEGDDKRTQEIFNKLIESKGYNENDWKVVGVYDCYFNGKELTSQEGKSITEDIMKLGPDSIFVQDHLNMFENFKTNPDQGYNMLDGDGSTEDKEITYSTRGEFDIENNLIRFVVIYHEELRDNKDDKRESQDPVLNLTNIDEKEIVVTETIKQDESLNFQIVQGAAKEQISNVQQDQESLINLSHIDNHQEANPEPTIASIPEKEQEQPIQKIEPEVKVEAPVNFTQLNFTQPEVATPIVENIKVPINEVVISEKQEVIIEQPVIQKSETPLVNQEANPEPTIASIPEKEQEQPIQKIEPEVKVEDKIIKENEQQEITPKNQTLESRIKALFGIKETKPVNSERQTNISNEKKVVSSPKLETKLDQKVSNRELKVETREKPEKVIFSQKPEIKITNNKEINKKETIEKPKGTIIDFKSDSSQIKEKLNNVGGSIKIVESPRNTEQPIKPEYSKEYINFMRSLGIRLENENGTSFSGGQQSGFIKEDDNKQTLKGRSNNNPVVLNGISLKTVA